MSDPDIIPKWAYSRVSLIRVRKEYQFGAKAENIFTDNNVYVFSVETHNSIVYFFVDIGNWALYW